MTEEEGTEEEVLALETKRYVTLGKLLRSADFKFFIEEFVRPRLRTEMDKMKHHGVLEEVYRAQGAVRELEFMTDGLAPTLEALKNTIDYVKQQTIEEDEGLPEHLRRKRKRSAGTGGRASS